MCCLGPVYLMGLLMKNKLLFLELESLQPDNSCEFTAVAASITKLTGKLLEVIFEDSGFIPAFIFS